MRGVLLQDWTTVGASSGSPVIQDAHSWLDLSGYHDVVVFAQVQAVSGSVILQYQGAPHRQSSLFATLAQFSVQTTTGSGPQTNNILQRHAAIPPARYLRWMATAQTAWSLTFSIWLSVHGGH